MHVAGHNSHKLYSTITEKFQKCKHLEEDLTKLWKLKAFCVVTSVLPTIGVILNKLHDVMRLLHILMQKSVILVTCRTVRKFLAE